MENKRFFQDRITIYHLTTKSAISTQDLNNLDVEQVNDIQVLRLLSEDIDEENNVYAIKMYFKQVYFRHNKKTNMIDKRT